MADPSFPPGPDIRVDGHRVAVVLRRELAAICVAAMIAVGLLQLVPGNWLMSLAPINILPTHEGDILIIQRATPRLPMETRVGYTVEIVEIDKRLTGYTGDTIVCRTTSVWAVRGTEPTELRILFKAWVGDATCNLRRGFTYIFRLKIDFQFFGFNKSVERESRAITMPIVRVVPPLGTPPTI